MAITNSPVTGTMKYLTIGENTYELAGSSGSGNGTVTSVGVSNATNGGLSISGSPITTSGSITIGHSNVLTNAQTTSGVYPIKIDKNGHISEYGNAVSIPTKVSDLTNDSGFVTTDTKNTAGSTNSNSKLFLIGATEQNANPQTYSNSKLYYNTGLHSEAESNYYDNLSTISQTSNSIKFNVFDESYDNIVLTMKNGAITLAGVDPSSSGFDPTNDYYLQYDAENNNMTIKGVVTPTADRDAANKAYVDSLPGLSSWAKASTKPSYTASQVGAAASDHVHGNLTNGGDITATAPTVASGDQIIINDDSASKITNGPTFGTSTTTYLRNDGTWDTPEGIPQQGISPIGIDTDNYDIYHQDSGVTAGTYAAAGSKDGSFYIPSFVVDIYGHITSATNLGTVLPTIGNASATTYGGLIKDYSFGSTLRTVSLYNTGFITSGSTSSTYTINTDTYGPYTYLNNWRVADVQAWNASTGKAVIVDWSVSTSGTAKIVTVSIAESYTDNINFVPIITTYSPM